MESVLIASVSLMKSRADDGTRRGNDIEYNERKWHVLIYSWSCFKESFFANFLLEDLLLEDLPWCHNPPFPSLTLRQDFSYLCLD